MKYKVQFDHYENHNVVEAVGRWPQTTTGAIKQSIIKWEWLVKWIEANPKEQVPLAGASSCALCQIHLDGLTCRECPIFLKTKHPLCRHTPYRAYMNAAEKNNHVVALAAARREVKFLKSLLPSK